MTALATCHSKGGQGTGRVQIILSLAILPVCAIGSGFILEQDRPSIGTAEWP
jgi:hypothetical protein